MRYRHIFRKMVKFFIYPSKIQRRKKHYIVTFDPMHFDWEKDYFVMFKKEGLILEGIELSILPGFGVAKLVCTEVENESKV